MNEQRPLEIVQVIYGSQARPLDSGEWRILVADTMTTTINRVLTTRRRSRDIKDILQDRDATEGIVTASRGMRFAPTPSCHR